MELIDVMLWKSSSSSWVLGCLAEYSQILLVSTDWFLKINDL